MWKFMVPVAGLEYIWNNVLEDKAGEMVETKIRKVPNLITRSSGFL